MEVEVKTKYVCMYIMWALQYIHDYLTKWHSFFLGAASKLVLVIKCDIGNMLYIHCKCKYILKSKSKQNTKYTYTSCWHSQYMHDKSAIAFDGNAHTVVGSMKKPQVSHDIGNRLNGGDQGQNTIGGAHL